MPLGAGAACHGGKRRCGLRGVRRRDGGGKARGDVRAAAGGRDRRDYRVRAGRRTGPGDGGRPPPSGAARGQWRLCRLSGTFPRERRQPVQPRPCRARRCWTMRATSTSRRKRPGGWRVMRRWSGCSTARGARFWTSAAGGGPSRQRCGGRWRCATGSAASRAARTSAPTHTTRATGLTSGRLRSITSCCCAGAITGRCTRRGSGSCWTQREKRSSRGRTAGRPAVPGAPPPPLCTGAALAACGRTAFVQP